MIMGAHGVRGQIRLRSFTEEPEAIARYGALTDESGNEKFDLKLRGTIKDHFIGSLSGVTDRNQAEALRGTQLYVERDALPKPNKREYYEADLVGLEARDRNTQISGHVKAVHNYGAGPFLEIEPTKGDSFMLPFTDIYVPQIDLKEGYLIIDLPQGWLTKSNKAGASST